VRPCALETHDGDNFARVELATAEAAAWSGDGMFVQSGYRFPEIRQAYREFYRSRSDWYADRSCYAEVGVVFSFDELHLENTHHLREVLPLARYLADHHVLFDFLNEVQIDIEHLRRFKLVIVPHVQYLPLAGREALMSYLSEGGAVLFTGNTGAYDEHARMITKDDTITRMRAGIQAIDNGILRNDSVGVSAVAWIDDIRTWFPKRSWQIHDLMDYHITMDRLRDSLIDELVAASGDEPADDPRLGLLLNELVNSSLSILDGQPTLRIAAWMKPEPTSLVLHLINYDVPGPGIQSDVGAVPAKDVHLSIPVPGGFVVSRVELATPWTSDVAELGWCDVNGRIELTVPQVDVYTVLNMH